jgi:hypothetical protein
MPTPAWVTPPNPAPGNVILASHIDDLATDALYLKDRVDNPPRAIVTHNATQSIATATTTVLTFNTESSDVTGMHSTVTNPSRLTVQTGEDGFYLITGWVDFAANATGQRTIAILLNGAFLVRHTVDAAASGDTYLTIAFHYALTAAQYLELAVVQNSGGNLNVATGPLFTAQRIA